MLPVRIEMKNTFYVFQNYNLYSTFIFNYNTYSFNERPRIRSTCTKLIYKSLNEYC